MSPDWSSDEVSQLQTGGIALFARENDVKRKTSPKLIIFFVDNAPKFQFEIVVLSLSPFFKNDVELAVFTSLPSIEVKVEPL